MCGGTSTGSIPFQAERGLSPRVRGNPLVPPVPVVPCGSIPACAGEPFPGAEIRNSCGVYPRVCGGTKVRCRLRAVSPGLSPRVRGNHASTAARPGMDGSIPACAGEPLSIVALSILTRVYPRVCGGTPSGAGVPLPSPGLSPRVRGNQKTWFREGKDLGSIPACAGEPLPPRAPVCVTRVYPRVCGGTGGGLPTEGNGGSIPACAGEPGAMVGTTFLNRVYPRVCGGTGNDHAVQ